MGRLKLRRNKAGMSGPLPKEFIRCEMEVEKRPSDEWVAMHQAEIDRGEAPEPEDDDMHVGLNCYMYLAIPNDKVPPNLWKQGRALLLTLTEVPYAEARAEAMADIARQDAPPPTVEEHRADLADVGAKALALARENQCALPDYAGQLNAVPPDLLGSDPEVGPVKRRGVLQRLLGR